jgi:acyl carrier protein
MQKHTRLSRLAADRYSGNNNAVHIGLNPQALFVSKAFTIAQLNRVVEPRGMSVRATVVSQFEQVAKEQERRLARLSDDLRLLDSGLDSLSFALIVVRLEEALGFDPFDVADDVRFPVTFGDFVRLYEIHPK